MSRPRKCRKVCCLPKVDEFHPKDKERESNIIILTIDEYETIRLIDKEGLSQKECADYMQVARTTVQQIYNSARVKIANALVDGSGLRIEGGDYTLCGEDESQCVSCSCKRHCKVMCEKCE
ncbi:MAG: DUF134 domain-containing protein [Acutalibacteraceae bacterium]